MSFSDDNSDSSFEGPDSPKFDSLSNLYRNNSIDSLLTEEEEQREMPQVDEIRKRKNPWKRLSLYLTGLPPMALRKKLMTAENLSDQEIESKFTSLSLAFKTDKLTLTNRLDLQQRQRDIAEKNIEEEIKQLKSALESLNHLCVDVETRGILQRIQQQVDVLRHASDRVSSSAEVYGAVQQEARISRAIDIVLLHVDNLKKIHDREHSELEECKRILAEHNLSIDDGGGSLSLGLGDLRSNPNRIRSVSVINHSNGSPHGVGSSSLSAGSLDSPKMRRASASVATLTQSKVQQNPDSQRSTLSNQVTLATPVNKLTRRVGIVTSSFRKTSSPSGSHLSATPVNVNLTGQELKLAGSSKEMKEDLVTRFKEDLMSNQMTDEANNNHTQLKSDQVKTNNNHAKNNSEAAHSKPKFRSRSLIEPVKEEDESLLMDEIDELAKKRDSSPAPPAFRNTVQNVRKNSLYMQLVQWYKELYWPWDWEETILGLRYSLTGLLLFAAFVSFIYTIFSAQRPSKPEL